MSTDKKTTKRLRMVSFRVDDEVAAALDAIEARVSGDVVMRRRRSVAIRRAILDAARTPKRG